MPIDLHTHTTYSDGTFTPLELLKLADSQKLSAFAITDHDEIEANRNVVDDKKNYAVEVVAGCEFSIDFELPGTAHLHLLGLFLDLENDELNSVLADLRAARKKRGYKIIEKLSSHGIKISNSELNLIVGEGSVGRPHIAQLLYQKNVVSSVWEAFNNYLAKNKIAYVPKKKLKLDAAIGLIKKAGGLSILAHPISLKQRRYRDTEKFLSQLKLAGLDGVEAYYPTHTKNFTKYLLNAAERNNLLVSGGSDFHGSVKPDTYLGTGKGNMEIPDKVFLDLKAAVLSK